MHILSPISLGSGSGVVHRCLSEHIPGYSLVPYSRYWELVPFAMPLIGRRSGRPDLVHTVLEHGFLFRRQGVPVVATAHNYVLDAGMRRYSSALQRIHYASDLRWLAMKAARVADAVTAVSQFVADMLKRDLGAARDVKVIYNGVDESRFCPRNGQNLRRRPFTILFCGNLSRRKKAELIPLLSAELGEGFEVLYTGGLSGSGRLEGRAGQGAGNMRGLGRLRHDQMPEIYQSVDALFMPSVREGFGLCVAEAMACGLPVVVDGSSAMGELVVDAQGGFLCAADDLDCYAKAFRRLADDRALAAEMGAFNRARVEGQFTLARMVSEYALLFSEVRDSFRA